MTLLMVVYGYWIAISLTGFAVMGFDKRRARRGGRRVPEKQIFLLAAAGGAVGVWYGMKLWRHKTKHHSFTTGIPYLVAVNILALLLITGFWVRGQAG